MQSVILDTQRSLAKVVREIDKMLLGDGIPPVVCLSFSHHLRLYTSV